MNSLQPQNFFFDLPLYTKIKVDQSNTDDFYRLMNFREVIHGYNPHLKENTSYSVRLERFLNAGNFDILSYEGFNRFDLTCVRTQFKITIFAHLEVSDAEDETNEYHFQKVGQFPSIAYLHISKIKEYDKVLPKEKMKEVTRAIGLAANGVGIGSFVYLRRVFEYLITESYKVAQTEGSINEEEYSKARMT